jgi:hypothetical protein
LKNLAIVGISLGKVPELGLYIPVTIALILPLYRPGVELKAVPESPPVILVSAPLSIDL